MRIIITAGAALLVACPGQRGTGPATRSFAQSVPVAVPSHAVVVDDHGGQSKHVQAAMTKGGLRKHVQVGDDKAAAQARQVRR
jgi:hypothetical protein